MPDTLTIGQKQFGPHQTLVIAEVGMAHDGSLGTAFAFIDAAASARVDAVKFQTHIAAAESTPGEPFRVKFSKQDASRYEYWKRLEFTPAQWKQLKDYAEAKGLIFLSSPFSFEAVDLLKDIGIGAWKVPSGEALNPAFLTYLAKTGLPLLISTGMSYWSELDRTVAALTSTQSKFLLFHCTSMYPAPPEQWGLNNIQEIRNRYACPVGLSDHSGTIFPALCAAWDGAIAIELHITLSRQMFGPDVSSSVTVEEMKELVRGVRMIDAARTASTDKDQVTKSLEPMRKLFGKSIVARRAMNSGAVLKKDDLCFKKPGTGVPAADVEAIVGKILKRDIAENEVLTYEHI